MAKSLFLDRRDAGAQLAERLDELDLQDPVVIALPRGGVPVGAEIATRLNCPLDIVLVRKIGVPGQPELAAGAVVEGPGSSIVFNRNVMRECGLDEQRVVAAAEKQRQVIAARRQAWMQNRANTDVEGRTVILVDDGLATGASMRAAVEAISASNPARLIVAVPVGPTSTVRKLQDIADDVVCLAQPEPFYALSPAYKDFHQLDDAEVTAILDAATRPQG